MEKLCLGKFNTMELCSEKTSAVARLRTMSRRNYVRGCCYNLSLVFCETFYEWTFLTVIVLLDRLKRKHGQSRTNFKSSLRNNNYIYI